MSVNGVGRTVTIELSPGRSTVYQVGRWYTLATGYNDRELAARCIAVVGDEVTFLCPEVAEA